MPFWMSEERSRRIILQFCMLGNSVSLTGVWEKKARLGFHVLILTVNYKGVKCFFVSIWSFFVYVSFKFFFVSIIEFFLCVSKEVF